MTDKAKNVSQPKGELAGSLQAKPAEQTAKVSCAASIVGHGLARNGVSFETAPMTEDTEITGPLMLNVWVSSTSPVIPSRA